ncbi:lytic transglycosylase domain-containing protein [Paralimibaculum aggregatum]|uniref:Lytic transglycosylase domain-containing protein n=1 Tax=Paralimibaculum aggregatum TaxID=3036245 RepID=A0ABQ6LHT2_9RHOB|nr:transglycosylase SLT domain-containing protein [Limibaculum sp. NKW23]GMG82846.1 lytic transglycosylase domain-containing protein [Limibaculum sp. NKW23]
MLRSAALLAPAAALLAQIATVAAAAPPTAPPISPRAPVAMAEAPAARPLTEAQRLGRICDLIEGAAAAHGLPADFFARLIYQESRFDEKAISPAGAQGIAQFMPGTAKARGLRDPWDIRQAIPASARFLADLRRAFGNWGLAAAAYNGGPGRIEAWLARGGYLPHETQGYVRAITFRPVEWFRARGREVEPRPLVEGKRFAEACRSLPILPTRAVLGQQLPWGVQIAGGRSHGAALRAARRVSRRYAAVLGGKPLSVVRNRRGIRGAPYQARIGAASRRAAGQLCARLKRAGGNCVVLRN